MKTLTASLQWLRRTLAALLVLSVLALQTQAPAAEAVEAADAMSWLVVNTGAEAETGQIVVKPSMHKPCHGEAQDPPCWGETVHHTAAWGTVPWLNEAPPHAGCPPLRPPELAFPERPPRA